MDKICKKEIKNNIRKKTETKQRGTLCALGPKRVTAAGRMPEEHIFYKKCMNQKTKSEISE